MKFSYFLLGMFTLLFCFCITDLQAQCKKSCTKSRTEKNTENNTKKKYDDTAYRVNRHRSVYKQCNRQRYTYRQDKETTTRARKVKFDKNYAGIIVGAATLLDEDQNSFATGMEFERFLNRQLGIGLGAEAVFAEDFKMILSVPLSFHPTSRIRLQASPLGAFQQKTVIDRNVPVASDEVITTEQWESAFGARLGVSYFLTTKGLKIAPVVRADFISGEVFLNYGLTAGLGF